MYQVSEAYLAALRQKTVSDSISGQIVLAGGSTITVTDSVLVKDTLKITRQLCGENYRIGTFNAACLRFSFFYDNALGLDLTGARIELTYSLDTGSGYESVPLGVFYADPVLSYRRKNIISVTAFDAAFLFDKPLSDTLKTMTGTAAELMTAVCSDVGVVTAFSASDLTGMPNSSLLVSGADKQIQSCRDMVMWCAALLCGYAFITRDGKLGIIPAKYSVEASDNSVIVSDRTVYADERFSITVTDTRAYIKYLTGYVGDKVVAYTSDYVSEDAQASPAAYALERNPLLAGCGDTDCDSANRSWLAYIDAFKQRGVKARLFGDPAIDPGDTIRFTGGDVDQRSVIIGVVTSYEWQYRNFHDIICAAAECCGSIAPGSGTNAASYIKSQTEKRIDAITVSSGVGEWLDDAHTCERFNCYEYDPESTGYGRGNYSDMAYCTVQGKDNVILSCDDKYEWVSAYDVINGQLNTMYACEWCYVGGRQNTLGCSDQWGTSGRPEYDTYSTIVHGEQNEIKNAYCSIVTGRGNKFPKTNWIAYSFITGENNGSLEGSRRVQSSVIAGQMNSLGDCYYSVIAGHNHNIEHALAALVCGEGAVMPAMGTTAEKKLVVGGGSRGNIFEVDIQGNCYLYDEMNARQYNTSGADYAEMYEWLDGNPDNEDRRGRFVTLDGEYIRIANADDDYILGVVSGAPSVVGDANEWHWKGKFKRDVFGAVILDENGEPVLSEDYDPGREYIPQSKRSEKSAVGSHGKLVVIDDGSCLVNGYCKPTDGGIATRSDDIHDYRVIKRIDENHIRIVLK